MARRPKPTYYRPPWWYDRQDRQRLREIRSMPGRNLDERLERSAQWARYEAQRKAERAAFPQIPPTIPGDSD